MRWIVIAPLVLAACAPRGMPEAEDGRALYLQHCAACHGNDARGAGPLARNLVTPPSDLTTLYAKGYNRAKVLSIIDGYERSAPGSAMPEWGAEIGGTLVPVDVGDGRLTPVPRPLAALLFYIERVQEDK